MLEFSPVFSPREMVEKGIFGGSYFNDGLLQEGDGYPFYEELFSGLDSDLLIREKYKPSVNKFKIRSGMDYFYWMQMNWIAEEDPHGWFEWYCKFYLGRRGSDDTRQISRWQDFCGPRGRWRNNIYKKIHATGDWNTAPRVQQSLLHWSYEVNKTDYELWKTLYT